MRYVNTAPLHQLGLTDEELAFLKPLAAERSDEFRKKHSISDTRQFEDQVYRSSGSLKHLTAKDYVHLIVDSDLASWTPNRRFKGQETVVDADGFGIQHSSYGYVSVTKPSGNRNDLVGSASVMGYYMDLEVGFCKVNVKEVREPSLFTDREILTLSLSGEQFFALQRTNNQPVPCKIQRILEGYTDSPPALYPMLAREDDFESEIKAICAPLSAKLSEFKELLKAGVSKKADREAVLEILEQAKVEFEAARIKIAELTTREGHQEVMRIERQFNAEMSTRLKTLGLEHMASALLQLRG